MGRPTATFLLLTCLGCLLLGCQPPAAPPPNPTAATQTAATQPEPTEPEEPAPPEPTKPDVAPLLAEVDTQLTAGELDKAAETLAMAEAQREALEATDVEKIAALRTRFDELLAERTTKRRAEQVALAQQLTEAGKFEEATQAIDEVQKNFPTDEERTLVDKLRRQIEDTRRRQRELGIAMQLLASDKPTDIRGARSKLLNDPDAALPLLSQAIAGKDPQLATNALGLLRSFNDPEKALPILLAVLSRPEQQTLWPTATRELTKLSTPGAGPKLLELATSIEDPGQRAAIVTALGEIVDPPAQTVTTLLPGVFQDSPELPALLRTLQHAATVNGQTDLLSLRGFPEGLPADVVSQLEKLPARLEALAGTSGDVAQAAQSLGIVTRLLAGNPLPDVKVVRASAESPDSSARNCLDGAWHTVNVQNMWRHPSDKPVVLVLDLGTERTVSGVKIWNHNEAGGRHRAWKEVEVFVGQTSNSPKPVGQGVVPMAPGVADPPDYGSVISVPCVRGRFVRVETRSYWQPDGTAGISELQVMGF